MDNKATIYINRGEGKFNPNHRKQSDFNAEYSAIDRQSGRKSVTLRTYFTGARFYACIWFMGDVNGAHVYNSGSGFAGGGGYCRESAAAASAIESAHVALENDISGMGTSQIEGAVLAIAAALGHKNQLFVKAHA